VLGGARGRADLGEQLVRGPGVFRNQVGERHRGTVQWADAPSHSTRAFRQAWRRSTLVLRGGPVDAINARLRTLGLPALEQTEGTPKNFRGLEAFYADFPRKPFMFGEWAMWGRDDPAFVRRFFSWVRSQKRVRMVLYNRGNSLDSPLKLSRYPASRAAIKTELRRKRYLGRP
jgi:hypothetical protein